MTISRSTPEAGYINSEIFKQLNVSQTVRTGNLVFFSGIVAAKGNMEIVGKGDPAAQVKFVLEVLGRLLAAEQLSFGNLVSVTVYTPILGALMQHIGLFVEAFKGHPPCFSAVGVKDLASPDYLLELIATASA